MKNNLAALCALALLASGCGKEQSVPMPGGDVKVTQKAGSSTVELSDAKGGKMLINAGDKGLALPDKFPSDVPIMPGAIVDVAMVVNDENLNVSFTVAAAQADAVKYYEENLKAGGWKIEGTMNVGEGSTMVTAKKNKRECHVSVVKDGSVTRVQLTTPREKS